jgi:hypothetical protein
MKAILEFTLPEEQEEHQNAVKGFCYKLALEDMDNYFRSRLKYEDGLSEEVRNALQEARNRLIYLTREATE